MEDNMNVENVEKWEQETEEKVTVKEKIGKVWSKAKPYVIGGVLGAGGLLVLALVTNGEDEDEEKLIESGTWTEPEELLPVIESLEPGERLEVTAPSEDE